MTTYDGNELRDALRARLTERYDARAQALEETAQEELLHLLGLSWQPGEEIPTLVTVLRSTDTGVAEKIEARAQTLEALAQSATINAQVNSVLP